MTAIVSIKDVSKTYEGGFTALGGINLDITRGEILALLGPNGAGKTTLISIICGITNATTGSVSVGGHDIVTGYRKTRAMIGLVPQELHTDAFETVRDTLGFSRGLFGKSKDEAVIDRVLRNLSLWDKRDQKIMTLSGGMKRRVMIAKALSHEPEVLFLDEPSSGVDVELRKDMWQTVEDLRQTGVTIILTTHYIEEAEEIADRIAVINKGQLALVEDKARLMTKLGKKSLTLHLSGPLEQIPPMLEKYALTFGEARSQLVYGFNRTGERTGVTSLLNDVARAGLTVCDLETHQSSLEEIFIDLVSERSGNGQQAGAR